MMTAREVTKLVEGYIGITDGYLNGFSYNIHDGFYIQYCDIEVDVADVRDVWNYALDVHQNT